MLDRQTYPLEIVRTVLQPGTICAVRSGGFTNSAYLILDRWALNNPDELKQLEQQGETAFVRRLKRQQTIEKRTLCSDSAWLASLQGMTDYEILLEAGIDMELHVAGRP